MHNRRNFLKLGGLAVAGGLIIGGNTGIFGQTGKKPGYFSLPSEIYSDRINLSARQTFEPYINTIFTVVAKNSPTVDLRLVEVAAGDRKKNNSNTTVVDSFSLIFEVVGKGVIRDEICEMSHPQLGEFSMFVSTVGRSRKRYQAVFSRVYI